MERCDASSLTERVLTKRLHELAVKNIKTGKHVWLRKVYRHKNLSTKEFQQVWTGWWKGTVPPRLEVDLILASEDPIEVIDKALVGCVEPEYFSFKDVGRKNFYEGLQQTMAFAIFGFDGLSLWHIFSTDVEDQIIDNYGDAVEELMRGFKLPIFYLAAKIVNEEKLVLKCYKPWKLEERTVDYFIDSLSRYWMEKGNRNPLLQDNKIKDRRKVVKMILKIPM